MRFLGLLILCFGITTTDAVRAAEVATMTVTGTGEIAAAPDIATVTLGAVAEAKTAQEAMDEVSAQVSAILATLQAAGVAPRDLQTSALSLSPLWSNRYDSTAPPRITGFRAENMLTVRLRDLDGLGGVLDAVLGEGANSFRSLAFGLSDPQPVQDAARSAAVADARRKARLYAEAAGLTLGPVLSFTESGGASPRPAMMEAARASADMPIAEGELTIRASVTMVFAIGG